MVDGALYVGRHDFGSVNPEIRIIESRIIEVLQYFDYRCPVLSTLLLYFQQSTYLFGIYKSYNSNLMFRMQCFFRTVVDMI